MTKQKELLVLVILDGWGIKDAYEGNAISQAKLINISGLIKEYPAASLVASGPKIGYRKEELPNCKKNYQILGTGSADKKKTGGLFSILCKNNIPQLYISEPDKYGFLINGFVGVDENFNPEKQTKLVSPSVVKNYSENSKMELGQITKLAVKAIESKQYGFIAISMANIDAVAHTGKIEAVIKAADFLDKSIGKIFKLILAQKGRLIITSDHGNGEQMLNMKTGEVDSVHSMNPVPFLAVDKELAGHNAGWPDPAGSDLSLVKPIGTIADVAPSILSFFDIKIKDKMTGHKLI